MKKTKRWILLTLAGTLAVLIGERMREAVVNDPDTLLGSS